MSLLVLLHRQTRFPKKYLIGPALLATDNTQLASSTNTTRFSKNAQLVRKSLFDSENHPNWQIRSFYLPFTHIDILNRLEEDYIPSHSRWEFHSSTSWVDPPHTVSKYRQCTPPHFTIPYFFCLYLSLFLHSQCLG